MAHDNSSDLLIFESGDVQLQLQEGPDGGLVCLAPGLARGLGFRTAAQMLRHVDTDLHGQTTADTAGGRQRVGYVTETGLYMIVGQRRPADIPDPDTRERVATFQRWVFGEVIPGIRQRGVYVDSQQFTPDQVKALAVLLAHFDDIRKHGRKAVEAYQYADPKGTYGSKDLPPGKTRREYYMLAARHGAAIGNLLAKGGANLVDSMRRDDNWNPPTLDDVDGDGR